MKWEGELQVVEAIYRGGPPKTRPARIRIYVDGSSEPVVGEVTWRVG